MIKPYVHARLSVRRYGGDPETFLPIHQWLDSTKQCHPDIRHRAILHNSFGCFLAEQVFGPNIITFSADADEALRAFKHDPSAENAEKYRVARDACNRLPDRRIVSVRDVVEQHIIEDCGKIPTVSDYLKNMTIQPWMAGGVAKYHEESAPQPVENEIIEPLEMYVD